ncbi:hypothetical protein ACWERI_34350 [Streptomyces collinus]
MTARKYHSRASMCMDDDNQDIQPADTEREVEELLRAEARAVSDLVSLHDTDDFMQRLARRITERASEPPRVQREEAADAAPVTGPSLPQVAPPATHSTAYRHDTVRPALRRPRRRRPSPVVRRDPTAHPQATRAYLRSVCEDVLRSADVDRLDLFGHDYEDDAAARTFACLLYIIERRKSAVFWWGFAAGAGDPLAAHLLATYYAIDDTTTPQARAWLCFSRLLKYHAPLHAPRPIQDTARLADGMARPWTDELRNFMTADPPPFLRP